MTIEVLGSGCPNCQRVEQNAKKAVTELGLMDVVVEHIYDIKKIIERGIMATPALAVDGRIKVAGRIPDVEEIKEILTKIQRD